MSDAQDRTDEELAGAAKRGDVAAFDVLVRRYLRPAMALSWQYTRRLEDAEDVVQDAFQSVAFRWIENSVAPREIAGTLIGGHAPPSVDALMVQFSPVLAVLDDEGEP